MAEVTRCRHDVTGAEWEAPSEALWAWSQLGWKPIGKSRTRDDAELERVEEAEAQAGRVAQVQDLVTADDAPSVATVLEHVANDPEAARVALAAEQGRPNPRVTLVTGLSKIIEESTTHG